MKYIQNNGRYGIAFEVEVNKRPRKVEFDRKRIYLDTGNIAFSGVTEVEDDVYEALQKNIRFKKCIKTGELELTEASALETTEKKNEVLEAENKELKAKLKEVQKGTPDKDTKEQLKAKDAEISSLKAQLEALTKQKEAVKDTEDTEGF